MNKKLPIKAISVNVTNIIGAGGWLYNDGKGDPYWAGGTDPKDYKWEITCTVAPQHHSSHLSRQKKRYNGYDINVGDFIATNTSGVALRIDSVESKTETEVVLLGTDIFRYNTYRDPAGTGNGGISLGSAVVFELSDQGKVSIDPVPEVGVSPTFGVNIVSRFEYLDLDSNYPLTQNNHNFAVGDVVAVDQINHEFVLSDSTYTTVIGRVVNISSDPNMFTIDPVQKVVDTLNYLPGDTGDSIYIDLDNPGKLTLEPGGTEVYIKLRNNTDTFTAGNRSGPTDAGNKFDINRQEVTVSGTGTALDMVTAINTVSELSGVTANLSLAPSTAETNLSLFYGEPALYSTPTPAVATINGVSVTFDISTVGQASYGIDLALEEDQAESINNAGIPDIVASTSANKLIISNMSGGTIDIVNVSPDKSNAEFAGVNSGSGIQLNTDASTDSFIVLGAEDARPIDLYDTVGTPTSDFGLISVENGIKASALYVEQGLRDSVSTTVVSNMSGRDALSPMVGDTCMVLDSDDGSGNKADEWSMWLWDGGIWIKTSDEDSAATDANSAKLVITPATTAEEIITRISNNSRVSLVTIDVNVPFDGNATITVGDNIVNNRLMNEDDTDLTWQSTYVSTSDYLYNVGQDTDITAYFDAGGSTTGEAIIVISYQ